MEAVESSYACAYNGVMAAEPLMELRSNSLGTSTPGRISVYPSEVEVMTAHGVIGMSTQRIRYDQIAQVLVRTHLFFADLIIETKGGATLTVGGLGKAEAWEAQQFVKGRADEALDAAPDTGAPRSNIPEQIQQLARLKDAGILTEAEFAEKKAELLKRL
jgi:hypothetical protein